MHHRHSRRTFVAGLAATVGFIATQAPGRAEAATKSASPADMARHERYMQLAIAQAKRNPGRPFGSVIVDDRSGDVVGEGVVNMSANPMYHSEVVAMNDYIAKHGNQGWANLTMYGTGEACPMCMSAMIWAGLPSVVYGSEMPFVRKYVNLINVRAKDVIAAAHPLYANKLLLGGVLSPITDAMFVERAKALAAPK
jgi:tRNA(Arg) A34 adenosine deaminase TadA